MCLEEKIIENSQNEEYQKEVIGAIKNLPEKTIIPNGKNIIATKIIPTETYFIYLEKRNQLNIPKQAEIINEEDKYAVEFKYKDLKYFICYNH